MQLGKRFLFGSGTPVFKNGYIRNTSLDACIETGLTEQDSSHVMDITMEFSCTPGDGLCAFGTGFGNRIFGTVDYNIYRDYGGLRLCHPAQNNVRLFVTSNTDSTRLTVNDENQGYAQALYEGFESGPYYFFKRPVDTSTGCYCIGRTLVKRDNVIVADFRPCEISLRAGMYDTVSKQFYWSNGVVFVKDDSWGAGF